MRGVTTTLALDDHLRSVDRQRATHCCFSYLRLQVGQMPLCTARDNVASCWHARNLTRLEALPRISITTKSGSGSATTGAALGSTTTGSKSNPFAITGSATSATV